MLNRPTFIDAPDDDVDRGLFCEFVRESGGRVVVCGEIGDEGDAPDDDCDRISCGKAFISGEIGDVGVVIDEDRDLTPGNDVSDECYIY